METQLFDPLLLRNIGKELIAKQETIAVAESVTSGLLQFAFSNMEDARKFYHGGLTAYNVAQKFKHLNVEAIHAISVDCVSQKVADEMALHVALFFNSDWGIGVTGYASPVPRQENKLFAHYAISFRGSVKLSGIIHADKLEPAQVQIKYVNEVLKKLGGLL